MQTLRLSLFTAGLALASSATAQVSEPALSPTELMDPIGVQALNLRCGLQPRPWQAGLLESTSDCSYNSTTVKTDYDPTSVLEIPVVFHVIQRTDGTGNISDAQVMSQIEVLNEDFRALAGSNGAPGFDSQIQFRLAELDPAGNPTNGITRSTNNTWYNDGGSYWNTLAWDPDNYLNIYSNSASGALGYVPDLPQGGSIVGSNADRVVVLWSSVGKNAPFVPYNWGRTVTHEVGHYLGLFHTFDFGCGTSSQPGCFSSGDRVCDTNSEGNPRFGCPTASSCGSLDPVTNYMDYTDDLCMSAFTEQQSNRMRCTLENWRPDLAEAACAAVAGQVSRNAGVNPSSYTANAPLAGGTLDLLVNLIPSGHSQALVVGFNSPITATLGGGQTLLVNVADPGGELLALGLQSGPLAFWSIPVVVGPSTCGLEMYTQAIHLGGVFPFALSNAQDLTVGF